MFFAQHCPINKQPALGGLKYGDTEMVFLSSKRKFHTQLLAESKFIWKLAYKHITARHVCIAWWLITINVIILRTYLRISRSLLEIKNGCWYFKYNTHLIFCLDVDASLTGNYTCIAVNLFGNDSITYTLIVLMPPSAPEVEVEYSTSNSIKVKWTKPENGGSTIQGT